MNQTILILPGWQDSGPQHWQSIWLKKYPNAVKVIQKDFMNPEKEEWVKTLNAYIEKYKDNEIILVGHSLACATFAHWSNEYFAKTSAKIKGALLVSPSDMDAPNFPEEIKGFAPMPIQKLAFKSIAVVSSNDRWVSLEKAKFFAEKWNAQLINIGPHGHINADTGFGEWSEGEKLLQELTQ
ncbi:MAG: alpha/beta hydrolase [Candidatus Peregrinibacteria bacterium]|nr:alpha/beta hydrolase [Candidatus Peregrinibacteria bacterium]